MIELRSWRQFGMLAEELHFGRAATRLNMTQPPLSQALQNLERELGVALFARTRRSVALTPAGAALVEPVRRLLAAAEALPGTAQAAAAGQAGQLRLAFVSSIAYGPLPEWLRGFRDAHPEVRLALREATLDVQLAAFDADEIDAGFVLHAPGAVPPGFGALTVLNEPMVMALPQSHPLASRRSLSLAALAAEPLVIFPRRIAPSLHDAILASYRATRATPRIAQEANQMQTIVNLVSAGIGVAWVPASVTRLQRPGVEYRPVPRTGLRCETSLIWREPALPVVRRFIDHVSAQRRQSRAGGFRRRAFGAR